LCTCTAAEPVKTLEEQHANVALPAPHAQCLRSRLDIQHGAGRAAVDIQRKTSDVSHTAAAAQLFDFERTVEVVLRAMCVSASTHH